MRGLSPAPSSPLEPAARVPSLAVVPGHTLPFHVLSVGPAGVDMPLPWGGCQWLRGKWGVKEECHVWHIVNIHTRESFPASTLPPTQTCTPALQGPLGGHFLNLTNSRGMLSGQVGLWGSSIGNHSAFYLVVFEEDGGAAVRSAGVHAAWRGPPPLNGVHSLRWEVLGEGWVRWRE